MKKLISLSMAAIILISLFLPAMSAFAATAADGITITSYDESLYFTKTQLGKLRVKISNAGEAVGAKALMYIDGYLQEGAGSEYFIIYQENNENFDVYIPPVLDPLADHVLGFKLVFGDGSFKEINVPFRVSPNFPGIKAQIVSEPLSVSPGTELCYGVKFTFGDANYGYRIRTATEINGTHIPQMDTTFSVGSGEIKYFTIPAQYTSVDLYKYNFKIIVNPNPGYGEESTSASSSVVMTGNSGRAYTEINSLVKPVIIRARVTNNTNAFAYSDLTGYRTTIAKGTELTYLNPDNHNSMKSAKVKTDSGSSYWVPMSNITITTRDYVIPDELTIDQKELFVNANGYESLTPYLVWVNIERQILTVFLGSKGNWRYLNTFPVATGKNATPTPTTQHPIEYVTRWVTPEYTCYPVLALYDGYALHNQPVSPSGRVTDSTIGRPASAGCVRMLQEHINWVHAYVPVKTNVVMY